MDRTGTAAASAIASGTAPEMVSEIVLGTQGCRTIPRRQEAADSITRISHRARRSKVLSSSNSLCKKRRPIGWDGPFLLSRHQHAASGQPLLIAHDSLLIALFYTL